MTSLSVMSTDIYERILSIETIDDYEKLKDDIPKDKDIIFLLIQNKYSNYNFNKKFKIVYPILKSVGV